MNHYVYKTCILGTNLYYIGKRSTHGEIYRDHYTGSGTLLLKHGKSLHQKTIISIHDSSDEAYLAEAILLGNLWKVDPNCLNRKPGGKGAPAGEDHHWFGKPTAYCKKAEEHHAFGKVRDDLTRTKISDGQLLRSPSTYLRGESHPLFGKPRPESVRRAIAEKLTGRKLEPFSEAHKKKISKGLTGYKRTEEHQARLNEALKGRRTGNPNPPARLCCCVCHKEVDVRNFSRHHKH